MKRLIAIAVAVMLLLTSCTNNGKTIAETERDKALSSAISLLGDALTELYLYQGEILVNQQVAPYYSPEGRKYYPVLPYRTLAELRNHSRRIFSEDFCANVLDKWTDDPRGLRFVEHEGKLWETNSIGNMGWIVLLVTDTIELVSLEEDRCVLSAYSQVLTGEVIREEFLMVREEDGWRVDSYYDFNRTLQAPTMGATVGDYLATLSGGDSELYRLAVRRSNGTSLDVDNSMIPPFASILGALEYDEATVTMVDALPPRQSGEEAGMELMLYSGNCELSGYDDGSLYITHPNGDIAQLRILHPGGIRLLADVIDAARWHLRDFANK